MWGALIAILVVLSCGVFLWAKLIRDRRINADDEALNQVSNCEAVHFHRKGK